MQANQGLHDCIVSFSYPTLRDVVLETMNGILEEWGFVPNEHYNLNKTEMVFDFPYTNGKILLRSGDRPDSLRGLNLDSYGLDEAREWKDRKIHDIMLGRLRRSKNASWRITTTTNGKDWVYELAQQEGLTVVTQTTMENPFLPDSYIEELKKSYSNEFARQELYADIVEFGAGFIQVQWFVLEDNPIGGNMCRSYDLAISEKTHADYTAGALCAKDDNNFYILDMVREQLKWPQMKAKIMDTAEIDGTSVPIVIEEAGQMGALVDDLMQEPRMSPYEIRTIKPKAKKFTRAQPWVARAERGRVKVKKGYWNKPFFDECSAFGPDDKNYINDDQIDAVSQAYEFLDTPRVSAFVL